MNDAELLQYIRETLKKGYSLEQIKQGLIDSGWSKSDVDKAVGIATKKNSGSIKLWIIPVIAIFAVIGIIAFILIDQNNQTQNTYTFDPEERFQEEIQQPRQEGYFGQSSGIIDCGNDLECLILASENCSNAKMLNTDNALIFGINQTTSTYIEILGLNQNDSRCIFFIRYENISIDFTEEFRNSLEEMNSSEEDINSQLDESKELAKTMIGLNGTCLIETESLNSMLIQWKDGNYSTEDFSDGECIGSMFQ